MSTWGGRRVARIRSALLVRDHIIGKGWRCWVCEQIETDPRRLTIEHITPRSQGGTDELGNLALSHASCNYSRGTRPIEVVREGIANRIAWVETLSAGTNR